MSEQLGRVATLALLLAACSSTPEPQAETPSPAPGVPEQQPNAFTAAPPTAGNPPTAAGAMAGAPAVPVSDAGSSPDHDARVPVDAAAAGQGAPPAGELPAEAPELAVTADFLNGTLSIVDIAALTDGATRADALVGTVDLSTYSPGPMSLAITPDGKTALVSISSGFLGAFISTPPGAGILLFVDLETRSVIGELDVGNSPMGIVVTPDSKTAFVGLYSERYFAVVDIESQTFDTVSTGASYNEELAIDDTGTVGILTFGPSGNARTFAVDDPAGTLGQTRGLSGDAAGVAFFPGTKMAYLMQAPTLLTGNVGGHDVIDVSDPAAPVASDNQRMGAHPTTYPVTAVAARGSVAFTSTENGVVSVVEMVLDGNTARQLQRVEVGPAASLAYGLTATAAGRVLIAVPGEHYVGVVDLEDGSAHRVPWDVTMSGPTEIKAVPHS